MPNARLGTARHSTVKSKEFVLHWPYVWTAAKWAAITSVTISLGALVTGGGSIQRFGRSLPVFLLMNWACMAYCGVAAGLIKPWLTTRWRAFWAAWLGLLPVGYVILAVFRPGGPFTAQCVVAVIGGFLNALGIAFVVWEPEEA